MSEGSPNKKSDSRGQDSAQRGDQASVLQEFKKTIEELVHYQNRNCLHVSKFEFVITLIIFGFSLWVLGIWLAPPNNQIVYIAFASAGFTYLTFLGTRAARRRKVRLTLRAELREHQSFIHDLATQFEKPPEDVQIRHTHLPTETFKSQTSELGHLTQKEINAVSEYYTLVEIYQALLDRSEDTEELWEKLDYREKPIPPKLVEQLQRARRELGSTDPEVEDFELETDE